MQAPTPPLGSLFAIGGAEAKLRRRTVLEAFVAAAGGSDARIAIVSSASSLAVEVVEVYTGVFTSLGARQVISLRPESRADARDPDLVEPLGKVSAVFLTGGNQLKLSSLITGTPFGDAIQEAYQRGTVIGGTSAGASILAEHMIAFGAGGSTPKQRMSQLSAGLGLLRGVVIDQHFEQRNRYGRLLSLVAQSPSLLGLGVDEDTAAVVHDGSRLEVIGRGVVTVVDGQHLISNAFAAKRTTPLLVSGAVLHILPEGSQFDLTSRTLLAHQTAVPDPEVLEARAVEADLRDVARDIAKG
jgi:cyanophycinase